MVTIILAYLRTHMSELPTLTCRNSGHVQSDDWLYVAPSSRLLPFLDRLADALDNLRAASRKARRSKKDMQARVKTSNEHFQDAVTHLIDKIHENASSSISGVRMICHDRAKMLDAQADMLTVSVRQMTACVEGRKTALVQGHLVGVMRVLLVATGMKELCKVTAKRQVPVKLDIPADVNGVLSGLEDRAVLRLYDVDGRRSNVSGAGLVSCFSFQFISGLLCIWKINY